MSAVISLRANLQRSLQLTTQRWKSGGPQKNAKLSERLAETVQQGPFPTVAKKAADRFLQKAESDKIMDWNEKIIGQPDENVKEGTRIASASMNADAEAGAAPGPVSNQRADVDGAGPDTSRPDKQ